MPCKILQGFIAQKQRTMSRSLLERCGIPWKPWRRCCNMRTVEKPSAMPPEMKPARPSCGPRHIIWTWNSARPCGHSSRGLWSPPGLWPWPMILPGSGRRLACGTAAGWWRPSHRPPLTITATACCICRRTLRDIGKMTRSCTMTEFPPKSESCWMPPPGTGWYCFRPTN